MAQIKCVLKNTLTSEHCIRDYPNNGLAAWASKRQIHQIYINLINSHLKKELKHLK